MLKQAPKGKTCPAILGLVEEGEEVMEDFEDSPALDTGLLSGAQAVEHYEISRYGTLIAWAEQLGMSQAMQLLEQTLDEDKENRRRFEQAGAGCHQSEGCLKT